jgi:hypothetical protein
MPFMFSHVEYCDMHYVYGYCDVNARAAVNECRRRHPERRIPPERVFTEMGIQLTTYVSHSSPNYYYRIKNLEFDVFRKANKFCFLAVSLHPHC